VSSTGHIISPDVAESLRARLGKLESGELLRIASDLRALVAHPGWERLVEYIGLEAAFQENAARKAPALLAREIAANPAAAASNLAYAGGQAVGLRKFEQIATNIVRLADQVAEHVETEE
jgi:hypothetical protein